MADILSHGPDPDREPPRWTSPRALTVAGVIGVAVVLLVRGIIAWSAPHSRTGQPSVPAATPRAGPGPAVPYGVTVNRAAGPKEPTQFTGVTMTSTGNRLLLTGPRPGWLWTATGRFQPIAGLPRWQPGYGFTRVTGGWAVQRYSPPQVRCQVCDAPPAVYFLANQQTRATVVGAAYDASAAASPGELWLTAYLPEADIDAASGTAQEVSLAGRAVGPPVQLPAGYVIDRAVRGGLLLAPYAPAMAPVRDELWDPATGRVIRDFTNVIAASADQVAWQACPAWCPLQILRLPRGTASIIRLPHGTWADGGTFSSDGRLLAIQVSTAIRPDEFAAATRLEVINTANAHLTALPGALISSLIGVSFGWQTRGDRLVAALVRPSGVVQLASWQPGDTQLRVQTIRLPSGTAPVLSDRG